MVEKMSEATWNAKTFESEISETLQLQWQIQIHRIQENVPNNQSKGQAIRYNVYFSDL